MQGSRRWIRRGVLAVLIVLAVVSIALILWGREPQPQTAPGPAEAPVVVALRPVQAGQVLTAEEVGVQFLDSGSLPSGAVTRLQDAMGQVVNRNLNVGDVLLVGDLATLLPEERGGAPDERDRALGSEWVAVALQAPDLWSQWGGIQAGDHIDLVASIQITVAAGLPSLVAAAAPTLALTVTTVSAEQVVLWTIQNLEVLQVLEEPLAEALDQEGESPLPYVPTRRLLLILKASPQDAAVLHFLRHTDAILDLAVRAGQNNRRFEVDAVTLDYLLRRYAPELR